MTTGRVLFFDVETHSADLLYTLRPAEMVRLIGYAWDDCAVILTTDLEELRTQIRAAAWIIGHNIHSFDFIAVFGGDSDEPLEFADSGRVYDTWTHASLVNPAPVVYTNRYGKNAIAEKPEQAKKWFSLDEQAFQLGVPGKTHDLRELAAEFGPDTPVYEYTDPSSGVPVKSLRPLDKVGAGFGMIPVDDPRYRDYLIGDVEASRHVAKALLKLGPIDDYAMREQRVASRAAVIKSNGMLVDQPVAERRVATLAARREVILTDLRERYQFPTTGDAPWANNEGKIAILAALADYGITPSTVDWPKTKSWDKRSAKIAESKQKAKTLEDKAAEWRSEIESGELPNRSVESRERWIERDLARAAEIRRNPLPPAFGLSLGGEELIGLTKGTAASELGVALAELKGQRSLAQLALDSVHPDGRVHPDITTIQRSRRWSTTNPGLTVWTSHGEGAIEKSYFLPDSDDEVLVELDYSNADARFVAAVSGDRRYAERFREDADGHMINAVAAWGQSVVDTDPKHYRQLGKPLGHGWSYGGREKGLARASGLPLETCREFVEGMDRAFRVLVRWQNDTRREARAGYVTSEWGGKLWVESDRVFTQAPALIGQNGTREIVCDALLRMGYHVLRRVKAQIHDAVLFSVPRRNWEECRDYLAGIMQTEFSPRRGGQIIEFPVTAGPAGDNWMEATHE